MTLIVGPAKSSTGRCTNEQDTFQDLSPGWPPNLTDLGPGFRKASSGSRRGRRRQQVVAAGWIASKHACVQKYALSPVCARACMQKPTTRPPRRDGVALVCPDRHVTPATKIDQCTQKARTKNAHAKYCVLDHPVRRPDKICTHAQTCQ